MDTLALDDDEVGEHLISYERVAQRLDCSPATVRRMASRGEFLPPILVGNLLRWRERDVNAWIAARGVATRKIEAAAAKSVEPQKRPRRG